MNVHQVRVGAMRGSARTPSLYAEWRCPSCGFTERHPPSVPNVWHVCPRLKGISIQLVRSHINAKIVVHEREDYVGDEHVQLLGEDRRPVMAVETVRDDGNDRVVYAPSIRGGRE